MAMDRDSAPPPPPPSPATPPPPVSLWERWGSRRILLLTVALLVLGAVVQVAVMAASGSLFGAVGAGSLAMVLVLRAVVRGRGDTCRSFCTLRPLRRPAAGGVLLVAAGCWYPVVALSTWSARLHPPSPEYLEMLRRALPRTPAAAAVTVLAAVVLGPLTEEIVLRGLVHRVFRRWWPAAGSAALSGLVFALLHGEPWFLFGLAALGVLLAAVYELAGTLAAPWLLHACFNAVSLGVMVTHPGSLDTGPVTCHVAWSALAASLAGLAAGLHLLRRTGPAGPVAPPPVRADRSAEDAPR